MYVVYFCATQILIYFYGDVCVLGIKQDPREKKQV